MNKQQFTHYITHSDFIALFNELGWDHFNHTLPIAMNDDIFRLEGIVEKKGFVILHCPPAADGRIPDRAIRRQIEHRVTQAYFEHLIIYTDQARTRQIWQLAFKEAGKPKLIRDIPYHTHQDPENLFQRLRGLLFTLDEEETITLVDVKARVAENFARNTEKVTKKFYTEFKKQHTAFLGFIEGIDDHLPNKENRAKHWYASLMLNRLMFCYFIQKKGFLDRNPDYLQTKLRESREQAGQNQFYSFYRGFLRYLFHDGLGRPESQRAGEVEFGRVPYLNGGLFDIHELERQFAEIDIKDEAFERIFNFFDTWNWHLDTRAEAAGNDINPDVIGYIFEKYINDRAAMGAYYTKDDITEYIGKNCMLPFLCDEVKRQYPAAFAAHGEIWRALRESGDTYMYEAVKHGVELDLPEHIAVGVNKVEATSEGGLHQTVGVHLTDGLQRSQSRAKDKSGGHLEGGLHSVAEGGLHSLLERRKHWNTPTPPEYGLPAEIWRETVARRQRYAEVTQRIEQGAITEINDFITYNLNIRQFLQDIIEQTDDANLIRQLYTAIVNVTVLDPTCGSGAFLFAALNILEPLYEGCLQRMELFAAEQPGKHKSFEDVLQEAHSARHPNLQYFIYKSIILNNLYGVDLMREAVEIAKLRLFLKLVATVDPNPRKANYGLEPLPDIDFNIRAGNTLVGFATEQELLDTISQREGLFAADKLAQFKEQCQVVSQAFSRFKDAQLIEDAGSKSFKASKQELIKRLGTLNNELSRYLASNYGISEANISDPKKHEEKYHHWLDTHQPFHWFAEFYDILTEQGGFDVIIGNPPYVEYRIAKKDYTLPKNKYLSEKAGNLYAFCMERACELLSSEGRMGMIVPASVVGLANCISLREVLLAKFGMNICSTYSIRPSKLFDGVDQRLCIYLGETAIVEKKSIFSSSYKHWHSEERDSLFELLEFASCQVHKRLERIPQVGSHYTHSILSKLESQKGKTIAHYFAKGKNGFLMHYHRSPRYWIRSMDFEQYFRSQTRQRSVHHFRDLYFSNQKSGKTIGAMLNSSLFFLWFITLGNGRNITGDDVSKFPVGELTDLEDSTPELFDSLMKDYKQNSFIRQREDCEYQEFRPNLSKPFINEIDKVLAEHYGFTEKELDFIINYDIKYRMGKELNGEE